MGVIGLEGNATKIAATLGIVHDNTVQGNVIDGADMGVYFYTVTNLAIRQNEIRNCNEGIHIKDGSDGNTINYNNMVGNVIGLNMSARAQVYNNTIEGGRAGIWLGTGPYSISTTIKGNTITDFVKAGIVTRGAKDIFIEGNTITTTIHDEAPNGIDIGTYSGTTGTIKENEISGCSWKDFTGDYETSWSGSGILVIESGDSFEITRNIVHDSDVGMDIESDSTNITRNEVYSNIYGFVFWNGKPKVNYNNIYNNTQYGVYRTYDLTGVLNAEYNYWGDSSGPSGVGPGTGDAVSGNVSFDPWLSCYQPQVETKIYINPPLVETYALAGIECSEFEVDVRIRSVTDLWGFDFELIWNSTLLNLTKVEYESQLNTLWGQNLWSVIENKSSAGWCKFAALALNPATGFSGSEALVRLTFHVEYGPCYIEPDYQLQTRLHFALVKLSDSKAESICTQVQDGTYIIHAVKPWLRMYYTRTLSANITCRKLGETFTLRIKLVDAFKVCDFKIEIHYNTTLMNPATINWGNLTDFLPGPYLIQEYTVDYVNGLIRFHLSENVTAGAPLAYGDGVLAEITFNVTKTKMWKKIDDCPGWENYFHDLIEFTYWNISTRCPSIHFLTGDLVHISNAEYWYIPIQGDINGDGDVDILDLRTVAYYYEVKQGDPDWTVASKYDLKCDGIIDIFDLTLIATNFGYEYEY